MLAIGHPDILETPIQIKIKLKIKSNQIKITIKIKIKLIKIKIKNCMCRRGHSPQCVETATTSRVARSEPRSLQQSLQNQV